MTKDTEIQEQYRHDMNTLAKALDTYFNGIDGPKRVAFVLLITGFDNMVGRVNYISNGQRKDIVVMLKEILARFEGQPEQKGTA